MITRLRAPLDSGDIGEPVVAAVALADLALDALVAALFAQHPRLEYESFLRPDAWDIELRNAQLAASLARALQRVLAEYAQVLAEHIERKRASDEIAF